MHVFLLINKDFTVCAVVTEGVSVAQLLPALFKPISTCMLRGLTYRCWLILRQGVIYCENSRHGKSTIFAICREIAASLPPSLLQQMTAAVRWLN